MTDQPSVKLLPGERVLIEDIDGMLILTTRRVRFSQRGRGQSIFTSITLDTVASCGLATVGSPDCCYLPFSLYWAQFGTGICLIKIAVSHQ